MSCAALAVCVAGSPERAWGDDPAAAGRRLFRDGRLASGEPLTALVSGDVPVTGSQFSCQACHGRSGMGAGEGAIRVPPASALLFEPSPQRRRPAYDEASLARALRDGLDPSGRRLDPLMPRYRLGDDDVGALSRYLRALSAGPSPGVTESVVRFATVITPEVPPGTRAAVLDVLRRFVEEKSRDTRVESRRIGHGSPPGEPRPSTYRAWSHEVWELAGGAQTWEAQLEARYAALPVFALLGGLGDAHWDPIARFCERHELPAILPSTDLPAGGDGFYTLYFSRGLLLEADIAAADIAASGLEEVVQVYEAGTPGEAAARRLAAALAARGVAVVGRTPGAGPIAAGPDAAVVLWLRRAQLGRTAQSPAAARVYLSSTLLERALEGLPATGAATVALHPFALPGAPDPALTRFRAWRRGRGIPAADERRQAEAWFACLAASEGLMHAGRFLVRDYVLDSLDHAQGLPSYLPLRFRGSTGPGQRFLVKGGYVLPLRDGRAKPDEAKWIVP
jgi:hypothetical protein